MSLPIRLARMVGNKARANVRCKPAVRIRIEQLEDRITPGYTVTDTAATLTFVGDNANQSLTVWATSTDVRYKVNGGADVVLSNAKPSTLKKVVVQGGTGNENIDLSGLGANLTAMPGALGGAAVTAGVTQQARDATERTRRLMDLWQNCRHKVTGTIRTGVVLRLIDELFKSPFIAVARAASVMGFAPSHAQ